MTHPPSNDIAASEPQADQLPQAIPDDVLAVANYLGSGNFDEAVEEITREMLLVAQAECVTRAQAIYEGIDSYATLDLFVGLWTQGLSAGAKNPQGDWATLLQTVQAARQAIASVRAATTVAQVGAVVVQWPQ